MIDLNDMRVFERVSVLKNFSAAARALDMPRSSVSRSIQRLEAGLSTRLLQRTTREVVLTQTGEELHVRCAGLLGQLTRALDYVGSLNESPCGCLRISAGIGFGINVLGELLPGFLQRHPKVDVVLDLSSQPADLVGDRIDVAIRMGPMPDSQIVARRLGVLNRYLCASPDYLRRRGTPGCFEDLRQHDLIELPPADGRKPNLQFIRGGKVADHKQAARVCVNDALTIHKLILNGAGIGVTSGYLCAPDLKTGRLVRLFPDWMLPSVQVHAVFPTRRELSPTVRAFVDYMADECRPGHHWQNDPLVNGGKT